MIQVEHRAYQRYQREDDHHTAYHLINNKNAIGIKLAAYLVDEPGKTKPPQQGAKHDAEIAHAHLNRHVGNHKGKLRVCGHEEEHDEQKAEELDWFGNLIRMMNEEGKREYGHLDINRVLLKDVIDLHGMLLQSSKFPIYNAEYYKVLPYIVELRNKGDKDVNEIETCLDALYGVMMLRLQKKEITPETARAVTEISTFVGMLSDYYIKDRKEGLKFDDDM